MQKTEHGDIVEPWAQPGSQRLVDILIFSNLTSKFFPHMYFSYLSWKMFVLAYCKNILVCEAYL